MSRIKMRGVAINSGRVDAVTAMKLLLGWDDEEAEAGPNGLVGDAEDERDMRVRGVAGRANWNACGRWDGVHAVKLDAV